MQPAKKGSPVQSMNAGVAPATPSHFQRSNSSGDANISVPVTMPVHMATSPMKACARRARGRCSRAPSRLAATAAAPSRAVRAGAARGEAPGRTE